MDNIGSINCEKLEFNKRLCETIHIKTFNGNLSSASLVDLLLFVLVLGEVLYNLHCWRENLHQTIIKSCI